ncbi:MAG: PD-(D/E)XK nuclease family protein [Planctomycetes bacterium]|nr:PD-(D/E)XK nuclease family protein [Planctomycetota bacterium]
MAVRFVLGRAGVGKTRHCLDSILRELDEPTHAGPLLLLVPEQATFQMERELALRARRRGYSRAEVLSFSRLARRVIGETQAAAGELLPSSRALVARVLATQAPESVRAFGDAGRTEGFYRRLGKLFEELLAGNVQPAALREAAAALDAASAKARVIAIAGLFERYLAWIAANRTDPALRLALLRQQLLEAHWLNSADVWIDGFAGFTEQELATVLALAARARSLEITLLLDPHALAAAGEGHGDPLRLFHQTETTYWRLWRDFQGAGVAVLPALTLGAGVPPRYRESPSLAALEAAFVQGRAAPTDDEATAPAEFRVLECETCREEFRQAARFIRRRIIDSGGALHYRDFALIARDLGPLANVAAEVLCDYGIPHFLDQRRRLGGHPLSRLVASMLDAVRRDLPLAAMVSLLRTGLLPLTQDERERIENLAVAEAVKGHAAWRKAVWSSDARQVAEQSDLDRARLRVLDALMPLVRLTGGGPAPAKEWCRLLGDALETLDVRRRLEEWIAAARERRQFEAAETHRLAWDALRGLLADVGGILGDSPLPADDFAAIVNDSLAEHTLGLAPPTVDQVLVGSVERSRHPDVKFAWIVGFNEGVFPAPPAEDALLSEGERRALAATGLRAPLTARDDAYGEQLLAYIATTRPSRSLTVSYARVGPGGEELFPSPLLGAIRRVCPALKVERAVADDPPTTVAELASMILRVDSSGDPRPGMVADRLRAAPGVTDALNRQLRGQSYDNACASLAFSTPAGRRVWGATPSELETYLQCPFRHLAQYRLDIETVRGPRPIEWELGERAHELMAEVVGRAIDTGAAVQEIADEQWLAWLGQSVQSRCVADEDDARMRPQAGALRSALVPFVRELLLAQAARWRRGEWEPLAVERRFGGLREIGHLSALEIDVPDLGRVLVRGVIDRVDGCRIGGRLYLLVYDYKSSAATVRARTLTGHRLQVLTYLLAVAHAWAGDKDAAVAGGVLLTPLYPDWSVLDKAFANAAGVGAEERRMFLYRPRGVFRDGIADALDRRNREGTSPVAAMKRKKDGSFDSHSDARTAAEVADRLRHAEDTIAVAARDFLSGRIEPSPLVEGRRRACHTCDLLNVCRFEPIFNKVRPAERSLPVFEEKKTEADA